MSGSTTPTTAQAPAAPAVGTAEHLHSLPPGSPERAAAAIAMNNGRHDPASPLAADVPEGVPSKFWSAETGTINADALLQSYLALEKRLGGAAPAPATTTPATAPAAPGTAPVDPASPLEIKPAAAATTDAVSDVVTAAGLDPAALAAKVRTAGALDAADYAALETAGIPKALVDQHVAALKVAHDHAQAANTAEALTYLGGEQQTATIMTWASENIPAAEITRLNAQLSSANYKDALDIIQGRYLRANPTPAPGSTEPALVAGGNGPATTAGYRSVAERTRDMQNPLYRTDPAFRAQVTAKMQVSRYDLDK